MPLTTSKNATETARYKWGLVVSELFNIAGSYVDAKKSACCSRVLVVTELVVSETRCIFYGHSVHEGRDFCLLVQGGVYLWVQWCASGSGGGGSDLGHTPPDTPHGYTPLWIHTHTHTTQRPTSGRYASYWNAFLVRVLQLGLSHVDVDDAILSSD